MDDPIVFLDLSVRETVLLHFGFNSLKTRFSPTPRFYS